jgi:FkbM family methyltransferase
VSTKSIFRNLYRSLPLKRPAIHAVRFLGLGRLLPSRIKTFLVFEGAFDVHMHDENAIFTINNGYGREIEASLFWEGSGSFETETMNLWRRLARDATVIIDVGANTGVYSLVAKAINPKAKVFAFEPISRVYQALETNLELNLGRWGESQIQGFQVALSDYDGVGEMFDLPVEHMYTASLNTDVHLERGNSMKSIKEKVSVQRMDHFCAIHNVVPDLIKIDVESHEPAVLRGMGDVLKRHQPTLICEIWNNTVGAAVEAALENCDYRYFAIGDSTLETTHVRNDTPELGYINYLFVSDKVASSLSL